MSETGPVPLPSADARAAHEFLFEIQTRITTRELPYRDGVEVTALESLVNVIKKGREIVPKHPGCKSAADAIARILDDILAPVTAKWHGLSVAGVLGGRDGADEFRGDLKRVQSLMRIEAKALYGMAYGTGASWDDETWEVPRELDPRLKAPLPFGVEGGRFAEANRELAETFARMDASEKSAVTMRRKLHGLQAREGADAFGLAFSGGGIRSASFSLGVAQVLADKGYLKRVDFLSTVSGGGYSGSFLTRRLGEDPAPGEAPGSDRVDAPNGPDTEAIRFLRLNAGYLSDDLAGKWLMLCQTLGGTILNWVVPLLVIVLAAFGAGMIGWGTPGFEVTRAKLLMYIAGAAGLALVGYGAGLKRGERAAAPWQGAFAWLLAAAAVLGLVGWVDGWFVRPDASAGAPSQLAWIRRLLGSGSLAGLSAMAVPLVGRLASSMKSPLVSSLLLGVAILVGALIVPVAGVMLFHALLPMGAKVLLPIAAILFLVASFAVDINRTGPRRMYQRRLARTFVRRSEGAPEDIPMQGINPRGTAPYHLINTTLNIPSSRTASLKERGCDFFLFSRDWTGSPSTGYHPTSKWKDAGADVGLAAAMATSGAAASSRMGLMALGSLAPLLTILNVRLGYWLRRPGAAGSVHPGFRRLLSEMTGSGMTEYADWFNLSDGGHIENTGIYELLRRRCKFILCVDGEADGGFRFPGLMTLVRHARIDLGVGIEPYLDELRADPKTGLSRSHFQLCPIAYPEGGRGLLLYLKLSVTGNESEFIRNYRVSHPEFPHESTADQFFDQAQFEAYRSLGVHVAESLFKPALLDAPAGSSTPTAASLPLEEWFGKMAYSLLSTAVPKAGPAAS